MAAQRTWYVDTMGGDDANTGRSPSRPLATLDRAWRGIAAARAPDATILIHAPEVSPLRAASGPGYVKDDGGMVRLAPLYAGDTWHCYGTQDATGGWIDQRGGVYSKAGALSAVTAPYPILLDKLDVNGNPTPVYTRNTVTPTTPAAGEYGYSGGTVYLHLPGGEDPNGHRIEVAAVQWLFLAHSQSTILVDGADLRGAQNGVVTCGSGTAGEEGGYVFSSNSSATYGLTGAWVHAGNGNGMKCRRCVGQLSDNDGFNHHATAGNGAVMELDECEGAYNADEGVSPHDDTVLILRGGRYHHNGYGGLTSVGNATTYLYGTEVDHNRTQDPDVSGWDKGGVAILEQSILVSLDLYSHDHPGPGVEIDKAAGATWTDNGGTRSGLDEGNGAVDSV